MQHLGHSRSAHARNHLLQTSDTFVRAARPGMRQAAAIVHISPAGGAAFTQYTVEFEREGELAPAAEQRFLYVIEGSLTPRLRKNSRVFAICSSVMPRVSMCVTSRTCSRSFTCPSVCILPR